ncbi:redoxin family protein [Flavobacterium sp. YO12]|uniref:redoxin family protein n=1 Tax=Flavobacterium sp. YO12 TaxID=1920029 RepID=UPI00100BC63A|nr:thioredoxin-like domain-containing protein [Flavobacterium sp. YO12]RXM48391.1 hypothetical protein BOW55_06295 [Flavobacterium sp. YO12]
MKKILLILAIAIVVAAGKKDTAIEYVTLSGKITNKNSDSLVIGQRKIIKKIKVNSDGTFSDTLKIKEGNYVLFDGKEKTNVYLKNGYDLQVTLDAKQFDETIKYTGKGELENNYLADRARLEEKKVNFENLMALSSLEFQNSIKSIKTELSSLLSNSKNMEPVFVEAQKKEIESLVKYLSETFESKQKLLAFKGKETPKFKDYENFSGGNVSLDDLKGKYVYIDLWATWCGPCKAEIPFLKEVESKYHDKNIVFVSISVDRIKDHDKWKKMVIDQKLSGMQLYAKGDQNFMKEYMVDGIPRFILIDPKGYIVSADAPRPSEKSLLELFKSLGI